MRLIAEPESPGYLAFRSEPDFHRWSLERDEAEDQEPWRLVHGGHGRQVRVPNEGSGLAPGAGE